MKLLFIVTQSEFGGAQRFVFEAAGYFAEQGNEVVVAAGEGDDGLNEKLKMKPARNASPARQPDLPEAATSLQTGGSHGGWHSDAGGNEKSFGGLRPFSSESFRLEEVVSEVEPPQCKIKNLKYLKRTPGPITALLAIKEITQLLKTEMPDVLFLCSTTAGILGSAAASSYKKKQKLLVVYRIGGWAFRDPRPWWQNAIILFLEKISAGGKDKIIVNSEIDRELALKYKIAREENITKIHNGVDINRLEFLPKEEARRLLISKANPSAISGQNYKIIGCVANFYKTKGLKYLIEAVKNFQLSPPPNGGVPPKAGNFQLLIIGDGRERKKLEGLIKKYDLGQTVFLVGKIPDAYRYLKAFDVFVLPSLKEGFPWIILEAMAAQAPIVATAVGAVPEIIENEKEGLLVEPKNSQALAEKIAWLLEHPAEAREIAESAREKVEQQFTREKMLEQTSEIIFRK